MIRSTITRSSSIAVGSAKYVTINITFRRAMLQLRPAISALCLSSCSLHVTPSPKSTSLPKIDQVKALPAGLTSCNDSSLSNVQLSGYEKESGAPGSLNSIQRMPSQVAQAFWLIKSLLSRLAP